ncbi:BrnA antitoxin family protein [Desulfosarcina sp. OttesenSCG-928-B08]|nr:BrnA antitoxin family protein [Desulfosarcina sp. OttesenSCG-928-B08]
MNKHDKSMWDRVNAMSDTQAEAGAMADSDNAPTDAMFWTDVDMQAPDTHKVPIHIRVSPDVLEFFKKGGPGYQTRINRVLEQYVSWQQQH